MISPPLPATSAGNPAAEPVVEAAATPARVADAIPLTVHLPVDARGVALAIMATVALIFALISLARSIERDPVWPWRPEFRRMVNTLFKRTP